MTVHIGWKPARLLPSLLIAVAGVVVFVAARYFLEAKPMGSDSGEMLIVGAVLFVSLAYFRRSCRMRSHSILRSLNTIAYSIATTLLVTACGRASVCADVGLDRLSVTDTTIVVGQSFVVGIENGGRCVNIPNSDSFGPPSPPSPNITGYWSTLDTAIVSVDSVSGQVIGKRIGDAIVKPTVVVTTGSHTLAVHVR